MRRYVYGLHLVFLALIILVRIGKNSRGVTNDCVSYGFQEQAIMPENGGVSKRVSVL